MKIILGSSSKPRRKVMEDNNYVFEIMSPDIDEKAIRSENYYELPLLLARAKAEALLSRIQKDEISRTNYEQAIIITADQITVCEGDLHEKPKDEKKGERIFK